MNNIFKSTRTGVIDNKDIEFNLCSRDKNAFNHLLNKIYLGYGYIKDYKDNTNEKRKFHLWIIKGE